MAPSSSWYGTWFSVALATPRAAASSPSLSCAFSPSLLCTGDEQCSRAEVEIRLSLYHPTQSIPYCTHSQRPFCPILHPIIHLVQQRHTPYVWLFPFLHSFSPFAPRSVLALSLRSSSVNPSSILPTSIPRTTTPHHTTAQHHAPGLGPASWSHGRRLHRRLGLHPFRAWLSPLPKLRVPRLVSPPTASQRASRVGSLPALHLLHCTLPGRIKGASVIASHRISSHPYIPDLVTNPTRNNKPWAEHHQPLRALQAQARGAGWRRRAHRQ